ncbi:hypothetical protein [Coleofasciculus sp. FACHB-1120]|uniref:hypothetical protein n=1 Tax=Coleofasciculus sp. FACHB-1120 TaxID=2692783 RepID=UPI001684E7AD|nr:hypothetical protein [Coleofasciculus sp. FACHB-1120]MBD2743952.1 hypothetical protein [Coleofasciculus sp. FACHB-1120]
MKSEFNRKQAFKLALVGAGALLFLAPAVQAAELAAGTSKISDRPIQLAAFND